MNKFEFRLEKVLNYKETVENLKKSEYGNLKYKLTLEEDKLNSFYEYKENLKNERNNLSYNTNVANLKLYNDYLNDIKHTIKNQKEFVKKAQNKVEIAKDELVEAMREKKMYEKLKENDYKEYLYEVKKAEEKLVDNIVTYKGTTQR